MYSDARICCVCRLVLFDVSSKYPSPGKNGEMRDEKNDWRDGLQKCHLYTFRFSRFANIFSCSRQFDDKCIAAYKHCYFHSQHVAKVANFTVYERIILYFPGLYSI